jgi:TRAP-type C4-dicarboxylate transport system permease small subunit
MNRILKLCNRVSSIISASLLFVMMILILSDVIGRFLFNNPIPGTIDFTRVFMAAVVFLGLSYTEECRGHIRATAFISRLPAKVVHYMDVFASFVGLILFLVIAWQGWIIFVESWSSGEYYPGIIQVPIYPARMLVFLGSILVCLQFIFNIIMSVSGKTEGVIASH